MSARLAAALVVLLVVLGGGAIVYFQQGQSQRPAELATLGQPLLKGLKAADVTAISIRDRKGALTLELRGGGWGIAERDGFPADFAKVRDFVIRALELRIGQVDPIGAQDRPRLKLLPPGQGAGSGTLVEFRRADGKALAAMVVGEKYFKRAPDDPARAPADGRFVILPADAGMVYVVADPLAQANSASAAWIDRDGFAVENLASLAVRPARGEGWKIARAGENAPWTLQGRKPGEKLDLTRANAAAYSLERVHLADVAAPEVSPALTGLATPTTITATTFDGLSYTILLGKPAGSDYYARLAVEGAPRTSRAAAKGESAAQAAERDREFAARLKGLEARLSRERSLAKYALLLPKASFDDVLKKRADLLRKKKSPKKA